MTDPDPATAERLFLFSSLTIFFALGCPRKRDGDLFVGESGYPEWLFLLQGTRAFVRVLGSRTEGPLAPMWNHGNDRWLVRQHLQPHNGGGGGDDDDVDFEHHQKPSSVYEHLDNIRSMIGVREADTRLCEIYTKAIDELEKSFLVFENDVAGTCELTDVFVWVYEVSDDLLPLLKEGTQEAVSIIAFFAVILKKLDKFWWLQGWADHLVAKSYNLLDEEHRLWVQWPVQEVGYVA
jgi:hypothetical protein